MVEPYTNIKLRTVQPSWVEVRGEQYLLLRDPLNLKENPTVVPRHLAPILSLLDGTRNMLTLRTGLALRTGITLTDNQLRDFIKSLDSALLLENDQFNKAVDRKLRTYRNANNRPPSHAEDVYPADAEALHVQIKGYGSNPERPIEPLVPSTPVVGVVSPHIDYERGGSTYAQLWERCAPALQDVELAIILGTDHWGNPGTVTLTKQNYATPFGVLPTDIDLVNRLERSLGTEMAYAEEIHHIGEHSIELAAVWFHNAINGRTCPTLPILCGSFSNFISGHDDPETHQTMNSTIDILRDEISKRRTLVIAAADLAHVGPTFGDRMPLDETAKSKVATDDARSLATICDGDASAFLEISKEENDSRKICGLPPIYITLRLLTGTRGESLGYKQCPADAQGASLVSIAGVLLYDDG